jgi:hypothetical protein
MRAAHFDSRRPVPQAGFPAERRPSLEAHSPLRGLDLPGPRLPRSAKSPDSARDQTNQCPSGSRPSRGPIEQGSGHHQGCRGHDGRARVDSGRLDPDARRRSVRGTATATATRSRASSARCTGAARWSLEADPGLNQRRLSGTVRADERRDRSLGDVQIQAADCQESLPIWPWPVPSPTRPARRPI